MQRGTVLITGTLALAFGALFMRAFPQRHSCFDLKVVRRTVEQGKPVVFFRVIGGGQGKTQLIGVERDITDAPSDESQEPSVTWTKAAKEFWAPSQPSPMGNPTIARNEFGVLAPSTTAG